MYCTFFKKHKKGHVLQKYMYFNSTCTFFTRICTFDSLGACLMLPFQKICTRLWNLNQFMNSTTSKQTQNNFFCHPLWFYDFMFSKFWFFQNSNFVSHFGRRRHAKWPDLRILEKVHGKVHGMYCTFSKVQVHEMYCTVLLPKRRVLYFFQKVRVLSTCTYGSPDNNILM